MPLSTSVDCTGRASTGDSPLDSPLETLPWRVPNLQYWWCRVDRQLGCGPSPDKLAVFVAVLVCEWSVLCVQRLYASPSFVNIDGCEMVLL